MQASDANRRAAIDRMVKRDMDHQRKQGKEPSYEKTQREWGKRQEKIDRGG